MSVLDRDALRASPLADLHAIASELSIDGYRRLRRDDLIDAILGRGGAPGGSASEEADHVAETGVEAGPEADAGEEAGVDAETEAEAPSRRRRGRRGGRGRGGARAEAADDDHESGDAEEPADEPEPTAASADDDEETVAGIVELLPNGSGFVRVEPPEPSDRDVYISAAQVKRCELVSGDAITGPRRAPRRSERFASLVRIDTINGRPAEELADSTRFDDLPAAFPSDRFRLGSDDPTITAIEFLTPIGRGSRVTITGAAGSGKTEALRRLSAALAGQEGLHVSLVLAGVRPEELGEWSRGPAEPTTALGFGVSPDARGHAIELAVDQARRIAARGADAVVLIDTLDDLPPHAARRALASARNIVDGGSLTVIATSTVPVGGETTVIALDRTLTSTGRFPALDLGLSSTLRADLLVGPAGAEAIARARAEALDAED